MKRLAKNLILAAAVVSTIFFVDLSSAKAASFYPAETYNMEKKCPRCADEVSLIHLDFWSKFRDTVMPDEPQDNNPPKVKPPPPSQDNKKPAPPPHRKLPKPAN